MEGQVLPRASRLSLSLLILQFPSKLATRSRHRHPITALKLRPTFSASTPTQSTMQFAAVFLFLLSISAAAAEDACPPSEVVKFAELYANPHLHPCQKVSAGFSLVPPMGYPTELQAKSMCAAEACRALVKDVLALEPADCYLSLSGAKLNALKMACIFREACEGGTDHKEHQDDKHKPTPKHSDDKHRPKPTEHDDKHYYPTPKPTEEKHYKTPKPTEEKYHPMPKPTEDKHYSTPTPTEDKHYDTPKPTEEKYDAPPDPEADEGRQVPRQAGRTEDRQGRPRGQRQLDDRVDRKGG